MQVLMSTLRSRFAPSVQRGLGSLVVASAIIACGGSPSSAVGEGEHAIIKGTASDESQNAVVLLVMIDRGEGGIGQCTGTMLAPNLVLTARHCVSTTQEGIACKADGTPIAGGRISKNKAAADIYVVTGTQRPTRPEANGQGAKLILNDATNLCNNDIALVVLKEPIPNVPIMPVRLDGPAVKGELLTAVGWGVTDKTQSPTTRQQRTGIPVTAGAGDSREQTGPSEFGVGESICSGDSGGPAIAETTGAIIGVVSRGGNGTQPTQNPATSCIGTNASNIYTDVSGFKDLILQGYAEAGQDPWIEGGPDPRLAKDGEACTENGACRSNACLSGKCTASCAKDPCAQGTTCQDSGGLKVCLPGAPQNGATTTTTTGCASSGGAPGGSSGGVLALALGAAFAFARRRRGAR